MQSSNKYQTTSYSAEPINKEIDYFKLPVESLRRNGFDVTMNTVPLAANEWLSLDTHLSTIDHNRVETVALNIQVGKGKTTACYKLIEKYSKDGYVVIVCSPFKRLVRKDCANLIALGLTPFNYESLKDAMDAAGKPGYHFDFEPHIDHDVHVMTINCLLQNPGVEAYDQHALKQKYLRKLLSHAKRSDKRVVMFFDEVHESVHNFYDELVPNLFKWKNLIHKAYVSSATYTPAAIPVLKYIGALTAGRITVYETPRLQIANPTSLHLHFTERAYSGNNLAPLHYLSNIISQNKGKKINILTAHKNVANALVNIKGNPTDEIVMAVSSLKPNLLTGDEEGDFAQDGNNIGTTFKTGVDIEDSDSVFVIIMPCISDKIDAYAIFSDGLPSIVQSLARVRHTGQVHVFMPLPTVIIDRPKDSAVLRNLRLNGLPDESSDMQNWFYPSLIKNYIEKKRRVQNEIQAIRQTQAGGLRLHYSYKSLSAMLIERSQRLLLKHHFSYGKQISPYVLWAAMYNQFCTTTLQQITLTTARRKVVPITKDDVRTKLAEEIPQEVMLKAQEQSLSNGINIVVDELGRGISSNGEEAVPIRFEYDGQELTPAELKEYPFFVRAIIGTLAYLYTEGAVDSVGKQQYILACTFAARTAIGNDNERLQLYRALAELRDEFLEFIHLKLYVSKTGECLIHREAFLELDESFILRSVEVITKLNESDPMLKKRVYPFGTALNRKAKPAEMRRVVYTEFRDCFTNITSERRYPEGRQDYYFLVDAAYAKELQPGMPRIPLL
jgi:hypothetical protein